MKFESFPSGSADEKKQTKAETPAANLETGEEIGQEATLLKRQMKDLGKKIKNPINANKLAHEGKEKLRHSTKRLVDVGSVLARQSVVGGSFWGGADNNDMTTSVLPAAMAGRALAELIPDNVVTSVNGAISDIFNGLLGRLPEQNGVIDPDYIPVWAYDGWSPTEEDRLRYKKKMEEKKKENKKN